jgi:hypothetical protein
VPRWRSGTGVAYRQPPSRGFMGDHDGAMAIVILYIGACSKAMVKAGKAIVRAL